MCKIGKAMGMIEKEEKKPEQTSSHASTEHEADQSKVGHNTEQAHSCEGDSCSHEEHKNK